MFQFLASILWILEWYYYYAGFLIFISVISIIIVTYQTRTVGQVSGNLGTCIKLKTKESNSLVSARQGTSIYIFVMKIFNGYDNNNDNKLKQNITQK